ncbi:cytosine/adenosine deaminase-related metal-dependent hydrolase [Palleronia aestuarii]|uniref:Cytosine/adenosine deaminase-related metal-dependent hydrolase n=1 Tax=Palleronia aestuarii TaxID=568105 RepID=A0A2W7N4E8_9RHOB|nr:amidohydrolase family protein [Palleronia aestuarii]PZX11724.1 cytosine/adenosine deaminase-related metal-dependent hydrolase [Palleronia aestuarii]
MSDTENPPAGSPVTVIRNAGWIVGWDAETGGHTYFRDGDVAFAGDRILQVGGRFDGEAVKEIDGRDRVVLPGMVNVHSHPSSEAMNKGFLDELGSPRLGMSSLYEFMPLFRPDDEGRQACVEVTYAELLLSGVTTLVDMSVAWDGWVETFARSGLRGVVSPMYRSGHWFTKNGHSVEYEYLADEGRSAMAEAMSVIETATAHECGRLSGMVSPSQIDTCTEGLVRESLDAAEEKGLPFQIHAAQSVVEFQEITRRHGRTPVEWLGDMGVLRPGSIIGHGIFLNDYPMVHWPHGNDFARLQESGVAVAHCPTVFQRRGITMQTVGRYIKGGIPIGIGTDTFPHNMFEELRAALILSRVMSGNVYDIRTSDIFDAATLGGARLLGRDDIGKLAPGAKADIVLVDASHPAMRPLRDPLRSLVYTAAERAVRDVFVDGRQVVEDGIVATIDLPASLDTLEAAQRRAEQEFARLDFAGRSHLDASPLTYREKSANG